MCAHLETPSNGTKSTGDVFADTVVNIDCDIGFRLSEQVPLLCQVDGKWNGTIPACRGEVFVNVAM